MKQHWSSWELEEYWSLNDKEQKLLSGLTGINRLGMVASLKFFQHEGRFPEGLEEIPSQVMEYLSKALNISTANFNDYESLSRSNKRHRAKIRDFLGFRPAKVEDTASAQNFLMERLKATGSNEEE